MTSLVSISRVPRLFANNLQICRRRGLNVDPDHVHMAPIYSGLILMEHKLFLSRMNFKKLSGHKFYLSRRNFKNFALCVGWIFNQIQERAWKSGIHWISEHIIRMEMYGLFFVGKVCTFILHASSWLRAHVVSFLLVQSLLVFSLHRKTARLFILSKLCYLAGKHEDGVR